MRMRTPRRMLCLTVALSMFLVACGDGDDETDDSNEPAAEDEDTDDGADDGADDASDDGGDSGDDAAGGSEGMEDGIVVRMDGEDREAYLARLYEAAQEEGQVFYYTSSGDQENETVLARWSEQYPDIELETVSATSGTILERALLEAETGNVQGDVYNGSSTDAVALDDLGALQEYTPANEQDLPEEFKLDGPYVVIGYLSFHPAFNTDLVDEEELPDEWMGYCDERWNGELAIDQEGYEWVTGILTGMGEEDGRAFLECLAENEPRLVRGSTNRTELLAAGEFGVSLDGYGHRLKQFEDEGAPIRVQRPSPEPMPLIPEMMMLMEQAPHPNAGRLLLEFFLTAEGQSVFTDQNKAGTVVAATGDHPYAEFMEGIDSPTLLGPKDADFTRGAEVFQEVFLSGQTG